MLLQTLLGNSRKCAFCKQAISALARGRLWKRIAVSALSQKCSARQALVCGRGTVSGDVLVKLIAYG